MADDTFTREDIYSELNDVRETYSHGEWTKSPESLGEFRAISMLATASQQYGRENVARVAREFLTAHDIAAHREKDPILDGFINGLFRG